MALMCSLRQNYESTRDLFINSVTNTQIHAGNYMVNNCQWTVRSHMYPELNMGLEKQLC